MASRAGRLIVLVFVALLAMAAITIVSNRYELAGALQAYRDTSAGRLTVKIVGFPLAYDSQYRALLKSRYGIDSVGVGCSPGSKQAREIAGYNWVTARAIRRKFGRDVSGELLNQVRGEWEATRAESGAAEYARAADSLIRLRLLTRR
jgi:hypothetical protein